ncbi:MAG: hypothetical protein ACI4PO_06345 [Faecousia sp.]
MDNHFQRTQKTVLGLIAVTLSLLLTLAACGSSGMTDLETDPSASVPSTMEDPSEAAPTETTVPATAPSETTPPATEPPETTTPATEPPEATAPATEPSTVESSGIVFLSWPETTARNQDATVTIQGAPNTTYSITVRYKSGPSTAKGLEDQVSDADGIVSWTWHIGGRTSAGTFTITVSGGGESETVNFTIEE